MKVKEFVSLEKRLLPTFPDFAIKDRLMFMIPLEHTLKGFHFQGSALDKTAFYVVAFFLPLWPPQEHLSFNFGNRLRYHGSEGWDITRPDVETVLRSEMLKEAAFLRSLRTPNDVIRALRSHATRSNDPYAHEAIACILAMEGKVNAAVESLDTLVKILDPSRLDPPVEWEQEMISRAEILKTKLLTDPTAARQQIEAWESETIRNLRLESFRTSAIGSSLNS